MGHASSFEHEPPDGLRVGAFADYQWPADADLAELFRGLTRTLQTSLAIQRGVLIVREQSAARLLAVSTFERGAVRKNLSMCIPDSASFFEQVAGDGNLFTDDYYGLFSGNSFEKRLLIGDDTKSYAVVPLKCDGRVVGLLAFSSTEQAAFTAVEEGLLSGLTDRLAAHISRGQTLSSGDSR